jgi:hypothetical protein
MNGLRKFGVIHIHTHNEAIRKNKIMWFEGKWMELESIILSKVSQVQKVRGHMFSLMWNIDLIQIQASLMKNRSCLGEVTYERGRVKEGSLEGE